MVAYLGAKFKGHAASRHDDDAPFDDDPSCLIDQSAQWVRGNH